MEKNYLKVGLYSQFVILCSSILNTKVTNGALVEDEDNKNESAITYQNEDKNDMNLFWSKKNTRHVQEKQLKRQKRGEISPK